MIEHNKIYNCDVREGLKLLPDNSIDCCITSPPYWSLRDYGISPTVWDGDSQCQHDWENYEINAEGYANEGKRWNHGCSRDENPEAWSKEILKGAFCKKCGAWLGNLGSEPNAELFVKHLCDVYDEVWKVLKPTGTNWVDLGDNYNGSGGAGGDYNEGGLREGQPKYKPTIKRNYPKKCLNLIPYRFAIEMVNRGWVLRNIVIWKKLNCMPSSSKDRFTNDYEPVFLFTKATETQYWVNENTMQLVEKQPLGTKGIEGMDWEWRPCRKCNGTGINTKEQSTKTPSDLIEKISSPHAHACRYKEVACKRCKDTGKVKHNFWRGHDYYFDQDGVRENHKEPWRSTGKKENRGIKYNNAEKGVCIIYCLCFISILRFQLNEYAIY